jgi:Glycosyl transferase 4-like
LTLQVEDIRGTSVKAPSESTPRKRVLFVATEDWFFRSHFLPMARAALAAGLDVAVAARTSDAASAIAAQGIRVIPIALSRGRLNPFGVLREAFNLWRLIARERPDILHLIALRAILVGNLAATLRDNCRKPKNCLGSANYLAHLHDIAETLAQLDSLRQRA